MTMNNILVRLYYKLGWISWPRTNRLEIFLCTIRLGMLVFAVASVVVSLIMVACEYFFNFTPSIIVIDIGIMHYAYAILLFASGWLIYQCIKWCMKGLIKVITVVFTPIYRFVARRTKRFRRWLTVRSIDVT